MNYHDRSDATLSSDGPDAHFHAYHHVDSVRGHAPSDAIIVPDAHFLFNADFKRSGVDLILSKDDHDLVLHDYFKGDKHAPLASPDGAHLTGDIVTALTGAVQYSQAGAPATAGQVIGHVTKLVGSATAIRNGVSIILNMGDNVQKGDVVQSGPDSTLGLTFIDGTVFGLSSNARMVLNDMVFDPNGSNNSSLLSLVAGTITFVAGETAKHGDMKVDTPVATMGIRGTAVLVEIDFTVPGQNTTPDAKFQVLVEPDGTTGSYILFDKTTLQPLAVVNQAGQQINISNGIVSQTSAPLSDEVQKLINDVFSLKFSANDTNPKTSTAFNDTINPLLTGPMIKLANGMTATPVYQLVNNSSNSSSTSSPLNFLTFIDPHIPDPPNVVVLNAGGTPATNFTLTALLGASGGLDKVSGRVNFTDINAADTPTVTVTFSSFTLQKGQQNISLSAAQQAEIAAIASQLAVVPDPGNNNNGGAVWTLSIANSALSFLTPGETLTLTYQAKVDNNYAPLDQAATEAFTITITGTQVSETWTAGTPGGGLWSNAANWETGAVPTANDDVIIISDPSTHLTPTFPVTIDASTLAVAKSLTMDDLSGTAPELDNFGTLTVGGALTLNDNSIIHNFGTISVGGQTDLDHSVLVNSGKFILAQGGEFQNQSSITNNAGATIEVAGGTLDVLVDVGNAGAITVDPGAILALTGATIDGGAVTVKGTLDLQGGAELENGTLTNTGHVEVSGAGNVLNGETVANTVDGVQNSGAVQVGAFSLLGLESTTIAGGTVINEGTIESTGTSAIDNVSFTNDGNLESIGGVLTIGHGALTNTGTIEANVGKLDIICEPVTNTGTLQAIDDSILKLISTTVSNTGGTISDTEGSTIDFAGSTISGGALTIAGVLDSTGISAINGAAITITATGEIDVSCGTLTIGNAGSLVNSGLLKVEGVGDLVIDGTLSGNAEIFDAAKLELGASASGAYSDATLTFAPKSSGTLEIDHSGTFGGTVAGLDDDDKLDLSDITSGTNTTVTFSGDSSGGTLTIVNNADPTQTAQIKLAGDYLGASWSVSSDGSGGTDVTEVPGAISGLDSHGNAVQDTTLTVSITDAGQPVTQATYTFETFADGKWTPVQTGQDNSYTPTETDEGKPLQVVLSFTDSSGNQDSSTVSAGTVQEAVGGDLVATLSSYSAQQDETIRVIQVTDGGIVVTTGLSYQWQESSDGGKDWTTVGTGSSFRPGESDEGKLLQLVVTYADAAGSESATYGLGMPNDLAVTVDGTTAQQGLPIHVTKVTDGDEVVFRGVTYAWQTSSDGGQDWTTVGTSSSYTPVAADDGKLLQLVVTYKDPGESESVTTSFGAVAAAVEWKGGTHHWEVPGQWTSPGVPTLDDNAVVDISGSYTLTVDQASTAHSLVVNDTGAKVEIVKGGTLTLDGNLTVDAGKFQIDSGGTLKEVATSATITGSFTDNGTIETHGALEVAGTSISGSGSFKIDAGGSLQLDHADALNVVFAGSGELILKDPGLFTGTVFDSGGSLTSDDVLDLVGFDTGASVNYLGTKLGGLVIVTEAGHLPDLIRVGANSTHWSSPVSDGNGGILIHDPPGDGGAPAAGDGAMPTPSHDQVAGQHDTGWGGGDGFVFKSNLGKDGFADEASGADSAQHNHSNLANLLSLLASAQDDGHGHGVGTVDAHDLHKLDGMKALLAAHHGDFHLL